MMLTIKQVSEALGIGELTVRKKVQAGDIKAALFGRIYRVSAFDLNKYIVDNGGTPLSDEDVANLQKNRKRRADFAGKE